MKHETFSKISRGLNALGCSNNEGVLDVTKIEKFIKEIDQFKSEVQDLLDFYSTNKFTSDRVIMSTKGNVYLVQSWKIGQDKENNIIWHGATVMDKAGNATVIAMDEVVPFSDTSKILFSKKE